MQVSADVFHIASPAATQSVKGPVKLRVSSNLENLEMLGNFDARKKVREFLKNKKGQGNVKEFCCVKFLFSQSEHTNFESFLGVHIHSGLEHTQEFNRSLKQSGKGQRISSLLETRHLGS